MLKPGTNHASGTFWIDERERIRLLLGLSILMNLVLMLVQRAPQGTLEPPLLGIRLSLVVIFSAALYFTRTDVVTARRAIVICFTTHQILLALTYPDTMDLHSAWTMSSGALVLIAFLVELSVAAQVWLVLFGVASIVCAILINTAVIPLAEVQWTPLAVGLVLAVFSIQVRSTARRAQTRHTSSPRTNADFLQAAIDALPSAVAILDRNFDTEVFNRAWHSLHLFEAAGCTGVNYLADLEHAAAGGDVHAAQVSERLRQLKTAPSESFSLTYSRNVGDERRWFAVDMATFAHDDDLHLVVVLDDITAIKLAEERARRAEVRFERAVRGSQHGIWEVDLKRGSLYCSDVLLQTFGFSRVDMKGTFESWLTYVHPDDLPALLEQTRRHLRGESARLDFEYRVRRKNGSFGWARVTGHCWPDESGQPAIVAGSLVDVTEEHRANEALAKSEDQLRTMVDSALHAIISIDPEGRVREFNPAATEALGYTREEVIGQPIEAYLPAEARAGILDFIRGMLHPPKTTRITGEATVYRKDGQELQMELSSFVGATQDGPRLYTFMRNISEQRRLDRLKDEMIATLSHELRTPLTSLRGFSELLMNKEFPEERRRRYLGIIHAESERMARLVNDFLDIHRAESAEASYHLRPVPLREVVDVALRQVPSLCRANHPVHVDLAADLPLLWTDADAMTRVLENLLTNACKFSRDGSPINISAQVQDVTIVCRVRDHGIGIPADEVPRLFEKFYRGEVARSHAIGGTGLGLPICRAILQALNGSIWVESTVGEGTTVAIAVPAAVPHATHPTSNPAAQLH